MFPKNPSAKEIPRSSRSSSVVMRRGDRKSADVTLKESNREELWGLLGSEERVGRLTREELWQQVASPDVASVKTSATTSHGVWNLEIRASWRTSGSSECDVSRGNSLRASRRKRGSEMASSTPGQQAHSWWWRLICIAKQNASILLSFRHCFFLFFPSQKNNNNLDCLEIKFHSSGICCEEEHLEISFLASFCSNKLGIASYINFENYDVPFESVLMGKIQAQTVSCISFWFYSSISTIP